jgi:hypothetical protein
MTWKPSSSGIWMSRNATSGRVVLIKSRASRPSLAHELEVSLRVDEIDYALARERLIVDDDNSNRLGRLN